MWAPEQRLAHNGDAALRGIPLPGKQHGRQADRVHLCTPGHQLQQRARHRLLAQVPLAHHQEPVLVIS